MTPDPASAPLSHRREYFESMYSSREDPWGFDERWYERRKYALTLAALGRPRYRRAFEPGCANGALTELLADRCDELVATEMIEKVAERARGRLSGRSGVEVGIATFPDGWPEGGGDLVVWSEIAYYLTPSGADAALDSLERWLAPDGELVAVHYTGPTDYPRQGAEIGEWLDGVGFLERTVRHDDELFELGVWRRRPGPED